MSKDELAEKISRIINQLENHEKRITRLEEQIEQHKRVSDISEIIIDKNAQINKLFEAVKSFIKLDMTDGSIFLENPTMYSQAQKILLHLAGKMILHSINETFEETSNLDELTSKLFLERTTIRARLSELRRKNLVIKTERGVYKLNLAFVDKIVSFILQS